MQEPGGKSKRRREIFTITILVVRLLASSAGRSQNSHPATSTKSNKNTSSLGSNFPYDLM